MVTRLANLHGSRCLATLLPCRSYASELLVEEEDAVFGHSWQIGDTKCRIQFLNLSDQDTEAQHLGGGFVPWETEAI